MRSTLFFLLLASCSLSALAQVKVIQYTAPAQYPETAIFDATRQTFLLSSIWSSKISILNLITSTTTDLVTDPDIAGLSVVGIATYGDRIYASLYSGVLTPAAQFEGIGAWNLHTGEQIFVKNLTALGGPPGDQKANGITTDTEGNVYITEDFLPIIWKVAPNGDAEILSDNTALFKTGPVIVPIPDFLNGIVYHPDGYLLTVSSNTGYLFKVNATTGEAKIVNGILLPAANGLHLRNDGRIVSVTSASALASLPPDPVNGPQDAAYLIESWGNNKWDAAVIIDVVPLDGSRFPTTAALVPNPVEGEPDLAYVNYSHLWDLALNIKTNQTTFELELIPFRF